MPYQRTKGIPVPKFEHGPACAGCPYRGRSRGFVPAVGGIARLMSKEIILGFNYAGMRDILIVGEAGGGNEIESGIPFSGGAGYELDKIFTHSHCGITRNDCTITNVVKCRPIQYTKTGPYVSPFTKDNKNRTPEPEMQRECFNRYLRHELEAFKGKLIVALGDIPLRNLTDKSGISKWRGTLQKTSLHGHRLMATYHPAYLMRNYGVFNDAVRDFSRIPLYLKGDIPDVKPEEFTLHPQVDDINQYADSILSVDIETDGHLDPHEGNIGVIGFAPNTTRAFVYPYTGEYAQRAKDVIERLPAVIGQNFYGFDGYWFLVKGIRPPKKIFDTLTMHHLAYSEAAHDLWTIHSGFAKRPVPSWKFKHHYKENIELVCARDVCNTYEAEEGLEDYLRKEGQWGAYVEDVQPLQWVFLILRLRGTRINREKMFAYHKGMQKQIRAREKMLSGAVGGGFNWRSPKQLGELLYDRMGFDEKYQRGTWKRTTNKEALDELWEKHPDSKILRVIMELRKLAKLDSTYFQLSTSPTARAHPQILAHGTATGRPACKEPNLFNLPDGPARSVYIPDEDDYRFVYGDYSQIELLIQAWYAKEWDVLKKGLEGYDFHRMVAAMFFGLEYDEIKKKDPRRHKAKFIDFGLNYGRGAASIAQANKLPLSEVQELIAKYFAVMPGMQRLRNESIQHVKRFGYDETVFHRRRWMRANDITKIFNFRSQSSAATVTCRALCKLFDREENYRVTPLTVYDSITLQCHKDDVPRVATLLRDTMMEPVKELAMPGAPEGIRFPVEIKVGENWGSYNERTNTKGLKTWEFK